MIAIIGTSDRPCWLAEACKILLLHTTNFTVIVVKSTWFACAAIAVLDRTPEAEWAAA